MSHNPIPVRCRAFLNDFSAFVDGELPPRRRDEIQAHVDCCQACLDHLTAYRRGITVLLSGVVTDHEDVLSALGVADELRAAGRLFDTTPAAIEHARQLVHAGGGPAPHVGAAAAAHA